MKVEIPQILWNCEDGSNKGLPTALMSLSLLPTSGSGKNHGSTGIGSKYCLATAGNCTDVNIWSIEFPVLSTCLLSPPQSQPRLPVPVDTTSTSTATSSSSMDPCGACVSAATNHSSHAASNKTKIDFLCSLTRHEGPVNVVAFSPNGQHLASASDTGSIIIWSVPTTKDISASPLSYCRNSPYVNYWTNRYIQKEADLSVKIISSTSRADSIIDLSWSADSKRFVVGTIDHTVMIYEDTHFNVNHNLVTATSSTTASPPHLLQQQQQQPSEFKMIYRNASYHSHFIQGVAFDPLQVYIASQSSDRTIRIWQRKEISIPGETSKKKSNTTTASSNHTTHSNHSSNSNALTTIATNTLLSSPSQQTTLHSNTTGSTTPVGTLLQRLQQKPLTKQEQHQLLLSRNKFDLQIKTKQIKYRTTALPVPDADMMNDTTTTTANEPSTPAGMTIQSKQFLFAAETTLESFVRRLKWTIDGAYLIVPAATWSFDSDEATASTAPSKFATLIYQRHKYDKPYKVLGGSDKPSIAVCPNPVLFKLLLSKPAANKLNTSDETKENCNSVSINAAMPAPSTLPPYRNIFAVLTWDSVLIYDTVHDQPLAIARGLHYANIVDASWTEDGHTLMVCSTDGYVSILRFTSGELGEVHDQQLGATVSQNIGAVSSPVDVSSSVSSMQVKTLIPPCEPGSAALQNPPKKKTRITPSPVSMGDKDNGAASNIDQKMQCHKRTASEAEIMESAVHKLSLVETNTTSMTFSTEAADPVLDGENPTILKSHGHQPPNDQYLTPPPMMKKQKKRIQPIQLLSQHQHQQQQKVPQEMQN